MQVGANQFVRNLAGVGNPAWDLGLADFVGENRERSRMIIAGRDLEAGEIDGVAKHAWRRAGLQPAQSETQSAKRIREMLGGGLAETAADALLLSGVLEGAKECACCDDDGACRQTSSVREDHG
jgi:hypothetical protein